MCTGLSISGGFDLCKECTKAELVLCFFRHTTAPFLLSARPAVLASLCGWVVGQNGLDCPCGCLFVCDIGKDIVPWCLQVPQLEMCIVVWKFWSVWTHSWWDTLSFLHLSFLICKRRIFPLNMNWVSLGLLFLAAFRVFLLCNNKNFDLQILCKYWISSNGFVERSSFLGWWLMWFSHRVLWLLKRLFLPVLWTAWRLCCFCFSLCCHVEEGTDTFCVAHRTEETSADRHGNGEGREAN
jgi:hypothetical protein